MVRPYTDKQLLEKARSLSSFSKIPSGYWLLGVRSMDDIPNTFDDKIYLFKGEEFVLVTSATTNPGTNTLKQFEKVNKDGAAVLKADEWYYNVWKYGKHNGKVEALLQLGNKVTVYRDTDKDLKAEDEFLLKWARMWNEMLDCPEGREMKDMLDYLVPRSQIIVARKP